MPANAIEIEKRLWGAPDELRANSKLKASENAEPVLGLLFLRFADAPFSGAEKRLEVSQSGQRRVDKDWIKDDQPDSRSACRWSTTRTTYGSSRPPRP